MRKKDEVLTSLKNKDYKALLVCFLQYLRRGRYAALFDALYDASCTKPCYKLNDGALTLRYHFDASNDKWEAWLENEQHDVIQRLEERDHKRAA